MADFEGLSTDLRESKAPDVAAQASAVLQDLMAHGQPREMTNEQIKVVREWFNSDLFVFAWYIMGYTDMDPELHRQMALYIESWGSQDNERLMAQWPRGHFKSSLGTLANALWQLAREPSQPVVIINETEDNTTNWLGAIRRIVETHPLFHTLYSDLIPRGVSMFDSQPKNRGLSWNDSSLQLEGLERRETEASITGFGISSATTGHHFPKMILDDIIAMRHRDSIAEMERVRKWLLTHGAIMRPSESGWCYVNCTPWTFNDVYCTMLEDHGYKLLRRHALEDEHGEPSLRGNPIFPGQFDRKKLIRIYRAGAASFNAQYMCNPMPGETMSFDIDWIRRFRVSGPSTSEPKSIHIHDRDYVSTKFQTNDTLPPQTILLEQLNKAIFFDPAPSEGPERRAEPRARNGIVVIGMDAWSRTYILEAEGYLETPLKVIDRLFELSRKWNAAKVFVEEVLFSSLYRHFMIMLKQSGQKWYGSKLVPFPVKPGRNDKGKRILAKVTGWESGQYYLNEHGTGDFEQEYLEYPHGLTVDTLDAAAYDYKLTRPLRDDEISRIAGRSRLHQLRRGMNKHTGY